MFLIELTGSPYYRSAHYVVDRPGARVVQRSRKQATRYTTQAEAERAAQGSWPNGFKATVVPA